MKATAARRCAVIACAALAFVPAPATAADAALLGDWRFDEGTGQLAGDSGPFALHAGLGEVDGSDAADPQWVPGASGGALRFSGAQLVRLPSDNRLAVPTITVEAVIRGATSPGPWRYVVARGSKDCIAGSYGLYTGAEAGMAFYIFDGSRYFVSPIARAADVWDGGWHVVTGTYDGQAVRLYLDGRLVGEPFPAPGPIDYASTSTNATFGTYVGTCALPLVGDVDAVRLWSGARTPRDVATDAGDTPGTPGPGSGGSAPTAADGSIIADTRIEKAPACSVTVSKTRVVVRRKSVVTVRLRDRRGPLRRVRVVVRDTARRRTVAAARTDRLGRARLVLRLRRTARLRVSVPTRTSCAPRSLRVVRG